MNYFTTHKTPIGKITLGSDGKSLTGLWIENQKYHGGTIFKEMKENTNLPIFRDTKQWLDGYFAGKNPTTTQMSFKPVGSKFQLRVWKMLCEIPYGKVTTYGTIARRIAKKMNKKNMASQAIGNAVSHNPISIIIPCHRVVGKNGSLTGYAGGISIKAKLLKLEKVDMSKLFIPK